MVHHQGQSVNKKQAAATRIQQLEATLLDTVATLQRVKLAYDTAIQMTVRQRELIQALEAAIEAEGYEIIYHTEGQPNAE